MQCDQQTIDAVVKIYNEVTEAHKRAPVEAYVKKQLEAGKTVELPAGHPRWSSALQFAGTVDDMQVHFLINEALPNAFQKILESIETTFNGRIAQMESGSDGNSV